MNKYMKMAIKEAEKGIGCGHGGPFGCVIVKDGKVIAKGHNEVLKKKDPTCHGEMMAIHKACKKLGTHDLTGCEAYTTGEPCPMCLAAILWANIDKVYYGCNIFDTEKIEEAKKSFIVELDREACLKLYDKYQSIEDKQNY